MDSKKAERIICIYNWVRFAIIVLFLTFVFVGAACAQSLDELVTELMIRF